tara:strand:+ start:767 stop:979 length:213 start_codon:yes stop_codon:yes gene_type:complete
MGQKERDYTTYLNKCAREAAEAMANRTPEQIKADKLEMGILQRANLLHTCEIEAAQQQITYELRNKVYIG